MYDGAIEEDECYGVFQAKAEANAFIKETLDEVRDYLEGFMDEADSDGMIDATARPNGEDPRHRDYDTRY